MALDIASAFSRLRHEKKISQRKAALELGVSQALLSHYENGVREPRLEFVVRACDYYGVSADYLLGRTGVRVNPLDTADLPVAGGAGTSLWESDELRRIVACVAGIFALLNERYDKAVLDKAAEYTLLSVYKLLCLTGVAVSEVAIERGEPCGAHSISMCDAAIKLAEAALSEAESTPAPEAAAVVSASAEECDNHTMIYQLLCELTEQAKLNISSITARRQA